MVAFDLLEQSKEPVSARRVANRTGLAFTSVNDILRFFRFHGGITAGTRPRVRWRRLAELTSHLRLPDIVPARTTSTTLPPAEISHHLNKHGIRHAFGFTTAANRWAFFEPDPTAHLIVAPRHAKHTVDLLKKHDAQGDSTVQVYVDDLDALRIEIFRMMPLTSRLQTWIDLTVFPHAGAHAAFFDQVIGKLYEEASRT